MAGSNREVTCGSGGGIMLNAPVGASKDAFEVTNWVGRTRSDSRGKSANATDCGECSGSVSAK